jgi:hypothetical protein
MSRTILTAFAVVAVAACGRGDKRDVAASDSLGRDLQLAPVDTTAALNDQPSATLETPTQPKPAAPKPKPKPAPSTPAPTPSPAASTPAPAPAAASRSLAAGTTISATTQAEIRSHTNKVGDEIMATVASDIKDQAGHVVIPAGSTVTLQVTAIKESENKGDSTGTLTLKPTAVTINGSSYPLSASIQGVNTHLEGRKTNAGDIAKVGGGAAAGAIVGRVLGGSTKGAIIGGIIGGAVGTQRAVETKDRDVVLPQGTTVTMSLDQTFVAQS